MKGTLHPPLQDRAALSYANREFGDAVATLNELVERQGDNPRWYEMRAQVHSFDQLLWHAVRSLTPALLCLPSGSVFPTRMVTCNA